MNNKKILKTIATVIFVLGALFVPTNEHGDNVTQVVGGLLTPNRGGLLAPQEADLSQVTYEFGAFNLPTERGGAASSSTGFEFGQLMVRNIAGASTASQSFTISSTSVGFAVTMGESGKVKGCSFALNATPTSGTVSIMIQKNATLQTTAYCELPSSATFAENGGLDDVSTNQMFSPSEEITFVAGDRFGLIASSSNLNAATFDANAKLIIQINN